MYAYALKIILINWFSSLRKSHSSEEVQDQQLMPEFDEARIRNSKIPLRHLKPCLEQHLDNGAKLANEEFADLREGLLKEATVGLLPENNKNNRFVSALIAYGDYNQLFLQLISVVLLFEIKDWRSNSCCLIYIV